VNPDPHNDPVWREIVGAYTEMAFYGAAIVFTIGAGVGFLVGWLL